MRLDEYLRYDLTDLAALVAAREVNRAELLDIAIARMEEVNPRLNAVVLDLRERACAEAAMWSEGPLAGVPYLLKDHGALLEGTPTAIGSPIFKRVVQQTDNHLVTALRRAGLVIFGKTNVPEMSNDAVTESALYGPARNPWDLERTPGGSSGGSAAAVAAGIVPAAHGSDGGGSIRIPAAFTGLFGLKPSRGRVSIAPVNERGAGVVVQHALTRSVRDSATLLDIVCGPQPGDLFFLPRPETPFAEEARRSPGKLRIGFSTAAFVDRPVSAECRAAVLDAAALCESLGHRVEEVTLPPECGLSSTLNAASIAFTLSLESARRGAAIERSEVDSVTWAAYQRGSKASALDYMAALEASLDYGRRLSEFCAPYDAILTSTTCIVAPKIGDLRAGLPDIAGYAEGLIDLVGQTRPANISGQPAMSVPIGRTSSGFPVGVQFIGGFGQEAKLLRLAAQLEQARPWRSVRPPGFE